MDVAYLLRRGPFVAGLVGCVETALVSIRALSGYEPDAILTGERPSGLLTRFRT